MSFMHMFLATASLAPIAMILYVCGAFTDKNKLLIAGSIMACLVLIALNLLSLAFFFFQI